MTSDELIYAGSKWGSHSYVYYHYTSDSTSSATGPSGSWWTMSPYRGGPEGDVLADEPSLLASHFGYITTYEGVGGIRPVVSLKSSISVSGSGTVNDLYVVN